MPWTETDVVDQRTEFVLRVLRGVEDFGAVCREYGISRKTGYKWKERFFTEGLSGLRDHSRRPVRSPSEIGEAMTCAIINLKLAHRGWGPRKIRAVLGRSLGTREIPSESSFKRILERVGLVQHRVRRSRAEQGARVQTPARAERPNHVWTIDFKGWWYTRNRRRFEPLTIRDDFSRYVLCAQALVNARTETVQEQLTRVFERFGRPEVMRSDNGSPFAARNSPLGLSRLSAWWLVLGIDLDRIPPGRPDQNGGHERMHRDLACEVERCAADDLVQQQAELDVWRQTFNEERPHEALGMRVPAEVYEPSPRKFDPSPVELEYPSNYAVRKVQTTGTITLHHKSINVSAALSGYEVGLEPVGECRWAVWFCRLRLGELDWTTDKFWPTATHATAQGERGERNFAKNFCPLAPGGKACGVSTQPKCEPKTID
jgi:transposase InsO family protein